VSNLYKIIVGKQHHLWIRCLKAVTRTYSLLTFSFKIFTEPFTELSTELLLD
jgi:hypothetical protein